LTFAEHDARNEMAFSTARDEPNARTFARCASLLRCDERRVLNLAQDGRVGAEWIAFRLPTTGKFDDFAFRGTPIDWPKRAGKGEFQRGQGGAAVADDLIGYDHLMQDALRSVVRAALQHAAGPRGLPGKHHFYVTFRTHAPGVTIP